MLGVGVASTRWPCLASALTLPGQEALLTRRFLFSPRTTDLPLHESVLYDIDFLDRRLRGIRILQSAWICVVAAASVGVAFLILTFLKDYFAQQTERIRQEEIELYGEYTSPDATRKDKKPRRGGRRKKDDDDDDF